MLSQNALIKGVRSASILRTFASIWRRGIHYDGRNRLSNFWTPTQRALNSDAETESGHDLLVRAGFLRQAHSGIFHLLPLGLRVQNKIERLIDKHMLRLGAAKVSLSSISSEDLWQKSGRLDKGRTSELFNLEDRKGAKYLLSPTHEEEITTIFANAVKSYKELPLRLYQVSRKYRDEPRPRQGLLRGREFVMKDLYTFDATEEEAHKTYNEVRKAYVAFLEDLRLPYLTARADSGNMGGDLSHEYHFASAFGEDTIIKCDTCDYSLNEELYVGKHLEQTEPKSEISAQIYMSKDKKSPMIIYYPVGEEPNIEAVKAIFPDVDPSVNVSDVWIAQTFEKKSIPLFRDPRLSKKAVMEQARDCEYVDEIHSAEVDGKPISLTKAKENDPCPSCSNGKLKLQQAVEIGHTFHLGKRYSIPLEAKVLDSNNKTIPVEMGCHGIGVSRLIGACASLLADKKGLNWPVAISPFSAIIVSASRIDPSDMSDVYDKLYDYVIETPEEERPAALDLDVAIDDRERDLGWKLNDADLVGYPFIVVLGKGWRVAREVEVQCRRLGVKESVTLWELGPRISELSKRL